MLVDQLSATTPLIATQDDVECEEALPPNVECEEAVPPVRTYSSCCEPSCCVFPTVFSPLAQQTLPSKCTELGCDFCTNGFREGQKV